MRSVIMLFNGPGRWATTQRLSISANSAGEDLAGHLHGLLLAVASKQTDKSPMESNSAALCLDLARRDRHLNPGALVMQVNADIARRAASLSGTGELPDATIR